MNLTLNVWILVILVMLALRGVVSKVAVSSCGATTTILVGYCLAPLMAMIQLLFEGSTMLVAVPTTALMWVGLHALSSLVAGVAQLLAIEGLETS